MSLVALACAKGSRGATTATLALGAVWPAPRVLLAECDPAGGSLAVRFGLRPAPGLLTLGSVGRRQLDPEEVWAHTQRLVGGGLEALIGPAFPEQAQALGRLWTMLPQALGRLDADVLADCGRLASSPATEPLLREADLVVLVCTPTREGVLQLQSRIESLASAGARPAVVLVGERPHSVRDVQALLDAAGPGHAEVAGVLIHDEQGASLLDGEPGRRRGLERSLLIRSARALAPRLAALLPRQGTEAALTADTDADGAAAFVEVSQ